MTARSPPISPLLMHVAEEDEFISKAAQAEIKAALAKKPNAMVYSYPGQNHAFSRHNGRITTPPRLTLPTVGLANFYINNYKEIRDDKKNRDRAVQPDDFQAV
ncbi:MAG: dienelactone hydrolase family protein [Candidatus Sulfotelmatobacter sp.]|nr:dienelactone hydrolase family protein [Candidatus Sulfotelmatobacter sp.]